MSNELVLSLEILVLDYEKIDLICILKDLSKYRRVLITENRSQRRR